MIDKSDAIIIFVIGMFSGVALLAAFNLIYGFVKDEIVDILSRAKKKTQ
jgi:hypothetical protein